MTLHLGAALLTLNAAISGTKSSRTVNITINPDPVISGVFPNGTVGAPYNATVKTSGGTIPFKGMTLSAGMLPTGLAFDPASGFVSGTPTVAGTFSFSISNTDSSAVPYTVTAQETVTIGSSGGIPPSLSLTGTPPSGVVGSPYSFSLVALGGTAPYLFTLTSGSLPLGLQLSTTTGVVSGIPASQGTSTFGVQVQDAAGSKVSAGFSITIASSSSALTLTITALPGGTVMIPYSQVIGVAGGTGLYTLDTDSFIPGIRHPRVTTSSPFSIRNRTEGSLISRSLASWTNRTKRSACVMAYLRVHQSDLRESEIR